MREIPVQELNMNPMTMIGSDWWLVTAGNERNGYNTMTAAWGHLGALWERKDGTKQRVLPLSTAIVYLRPQRYTKVFMDKEEFFTLSVFDSSHKKSLGYLGMHSGRDGDKIAASGLTPVFANNTTHFAEAKMVFVCRKLYRAPLLESGFIDHKLVDSNYPDKDFHEMYVGEIVKIMDMNGCV